MKTPVSNANILISCTDLVEIVIFAYLIWLGKISKDLDKTTKIAHGSLSGKTAGGGGRLSPRRLLWWWGPSQVNHKHALFSCFAPSESDGSTLTLSVDVF